MDVISPPRHSKTPPRRLQDAPRCAQDAPRRVQDAPRGLQDAMLVVFWIQNEGKLAPKSDWNSILAVKAKNQVNASWLAFSWLPGVEVGSKLC